jgi:hypothetical protein
VAERVEGVEAIQPRPSLPLPPGESDVRLAGDHAHERASVGLVEADGENDTWTAVIVSRHPDMLPVVAWPVEEPGTGRDMALQRGTASRTWLVPRRTPGVPDPALARRRQVARRDSEMGGVAVLLVAVPLVVVSVIVLDDDRNVGPAMNGEGRAARKPKGSGEDQTA